MMSTDEPPKPPSELAEKFRLDALLQQYKGTVDGHVEGIKFDYQGKLEEFKATIAFALAAIRYIALANGGAVLALLTFLGNLMAKSDAGAHMLASRLSLPMACFITGLILAILCAMFSYLAQVLFSEKRPAHGTSLPKSGNAMRWIALGCAFISVVAFGVGAWTSLLAFQDSIL